VAKFRFSEFRIRICFEFRISIFELLTIYFICIICMKRMICAKLPLMRTPAFGEANIGALAGAAIGATGGLFAIGIGPAIAGNNIRLLVGTPILGIVSLIVCGTLGWFIGGQLGPRLGGKFNTQRAETIGGIIGGLVPVVLVALWGWYMTAH
jgi:hypothetical protein